MAGLGAAGDPITLVDPAVTPVTPPPPPADPTISLSVIAASYGQQIFALTAGIAGSLAGFVLAYKLREARTLKTSEVLTAAAIAAAGAFGSVFVMRHYS